MILTEYDEKKGMDPREKGLVEHIVMQKKMKSFM